MEKRSFDKLNPREVLALAISLEEEHARTFAEFARQLAGVDAEVASQFELLQQEEEEHLALLKTKLEGVSKTDCPYLRREDVRGFLPTVKIPEPGLKTPSWYLRQAHTIEMETERFYLRSAATCEDPDLRSLFSELAEVEAEHQRQVETDSDDGNRQTDRELFLLQIVQPALVGLMDGSVSTLAPVFAAALATGNPWDAFLVGSAASVGAGISMGIAEGMSDDGALTGRGSPMLRGLVSGFMTFAGGIGHALPFLINDLNVALAVAVAVTAVELFAIAWIRNRFLEMSFWSSTLQVVAGGSVVVATGILIGSAH